MKASTFNKYFSVLTEAKNKALSLKEVCDKQGCNYNSLRGFISSILKQPTLKSEEAKQLITLYKSLTRCKPVENVTYNRDKSGHIESYTIHLPIGDNYFNCILNRQEAETIYGLYTYYGGNITARNVANEFPKYTLPEIRYIFRAFNLTKDSIWVPQHLIEEFSVEELNSYRFNLKERAAFKYADNKQDREYQSLINRMASKINTLERTLNNIKEIKVNITNTPAVNVKGIHIESDKDLIIHLSDMHIGARVESGCIYPNNWNEQELKRRLTEVLNRINSLGHLNTLIINLLGDSLDGMDNQTARRDHFMPQNMDNMEQVNMFINTMIWFVSSIKQNNLCNNIKIYSVKEGNHDGITGYAASYAALSCIKSLYPEIETTQFQEFFGYYEFKNHKFLISHGKNFYKF